MVWRSNASRNQGSSGRRRRSTRGRYSIRARAKLQRPSARNQKRQITTLAKMVTYNRKVLMAQRTFTDYVLTGSVNYGFPTQQIIPLMEVNLWQATLRQNIDVITQQRTYIRNMEFNWFMETQGVNNITQTTMFLVSIRPTASTWNPAVGLNQNQEWASQGSQNAVTLNPGIFKCHWTKHWTTFPNTSASYDPGGPLAGANILVPNGDPSDRYRKGRIRIKAKYSIRAPGQGPWKNMIQEQLPPHRRLFFLIFANQETPGGTTSLFNWGLRATCVNAD